MIKYIFILLIGFLLPVTTGCTDTNLTHDIPLVPRPAQIVPGSGNYLFSGKTVFAVENEEQAEVARSFIALFTRAAGFTPKLTVGDAEKGNVRFQTDATLKSEAYTLQVSPKEIIIEASDAKGFFYALQTIRQLFPASIEKEEVSDKKVKWSSDDPKVATVDSNGNVRAVSEGIASIRINKDDKYGFGIDYCIVTVERDLTLSALAWITLDAASNYYYDTGAGVKDMYVDTKGRLQIYFEAGSSYYWATATITDDPIYYWCYHPTIPNNKAIDVCLWRYGYTPDFKVDEMLTVSKVAYRKAQLKKQQDYIISK